MTEHMVDVMDKTGKILHTYPISLSASSPPISATMPWPSDADYVKAALSAAKTANLVPESDFASLRTRVHQAAPKPPREMRTNTGRRRCWDSIRCAPSPTQAAAVKLTTPKRHRTSAKEFG